LNKEKQKNPSRIIISSSQKTIHKKVSRYGYYNTGHALSAISYSLCREIPKMKL
jgi:hypothetical protein